MKRTVRLLTALLVLMLALTGCAKDAVPESTPEPVEGYDVLGGQYWEVGAIFYRNKIVDIHDNAALEDLYDGLYLLFGPDGDFMYYGIFPQKGTYQKYDVYDDYDSYLLTVEATLKYDSEKKELVEDEQRSKNATGFYLLTVMDEETLEFVPFDPITGKAKANEDPLYFVKSYEQSPYIADNKTELPAATKQPEAETSDSGKSGYSLNTYQGILDEYTARMEAAVPGLVSEYQSEAAGVSDIETLAEICNDKVGELAEICNEGVEKMAELMYSKGDSYDTYEKWAMKLQDNYSDIAMEIQDAYLDSATY